MYVWVCVLFVYGSLSVCPSSNLFLPSLYTTPPYRYHARKHAHTPIYATKSSCTRATSRIARDRMHISRMFDAGYKSGRKLCVVVCISVCMDTCASSGTDRGGSLNPRASLVYASVCVRVSVWENVCTRVSKSKETTNISQGTRIRVQTHTDTNIPFDLRTCILYVFVVTGKTYRLASSRSRS